MARLNAFIKSIAWYKLVPSGLAGMKTLIVNNASVSALTYVAAAAAADGTNLVAYVPPAHTQPIVVNMTAMSGSARALWFDPTDGTYSAAGSALSNAATMTFIPPGPNAAGANDWVLLLDRSTVVIPKAPMRPRVVRQVN
jgi:hypothetical protein